MVILLKRMEHMRACIIGNSNQVPRKWSMAEAKKLQLINQEWINRVWYRRSLISLVLLPLSALFWFIISIRKAVYKNIPGLQKTFSIPVIVVGNITVGGTGKTPMVIYLCEQLAKLGYKPAVASRGYGGNITAATLVQKSHDAVQVGDEPVLIFNRTNVPVMVGANRIEVIDKLVSTHNCDLVICDDGLQDYRFDHDVEILMIDGDRQFGNQRLLPAGPMREPLSRLAECDLRVVAAKAVLSLSEDTMQYKTHEIVMVGESDRTMPIDALQGQTVHAVAGIANPKRFFDVLRSHGLHVIEHAHDDHAVFSSSDLQFPDDYSVLITEKDAVKCTTLNLENVWYLPVTAQLPGTFIPRVQQQIRERNG